MIMKPSAYLHLLAFLLLSLSFPACEKDITDSVKINTKPDLVVNAFISPQDTAFEVRVTKSRPVVGKVISAEEARVKDATVRIFRGSQSVLLTYHPERQVYRAPTALLPVLAGQTYTLQVSTPDKYAVTGSCTVPVTDGVAITEVRHTKQQKSVEHGRDHEEHTFSYKWQDAPGRENYYHPIAVIENENPQNHLRTRQILFNADKPFFSDEKKDGLVFSSSQTFDYWPSPQSHRITALQFNLAVTDRAYFRYHQSLEQHQDADGNPFAEPVLVYSNVTGGLGIFAAYNQLQATLRVE
jgi:hypothetical protein